MFDREKGLYENSSKQDEKELKKALAILKFKFANCDKQALLKIILTLGAKINALEVELKNCKKE